MCLCSGVLKRLEEEDLDDNVKKRLKDSSETPGALWHVYASRDVEKVQEFLHKVTALRPFRFHGASHQQRGFPRRSLSHALPTLLSPSVLCCVSGCPYKTLHSS